MGLQNYAVTIPTENSCIEFNNNNINIEQRHDTAQNYTILHKVL